LRIGHLFFAKCEFEHIDLTASVRANNVRFSDCVLHGLTVESDGETVDYYDPEIMQACLSNAGAIFLRKEQAVLPVVSVPQDDKGRTDEAQATYRLYEKHSGQRISQIRLFSFGLLDGEVAGFGRLEPYGQSMSSA
jgi:hypothetical protein